MLIPWRAAAGAACSDRGAAIRAGRLAREQRGSALAPGSACPGRGAELGLPRAPALGEAMAGLATGAGLHSRPERASVATAGARVPPRGHHTALQERDGTPCVAAAGGRRPLPSSGSGPGLGPHRAEPQPLRRG